MLQSDRKTHGSREDALIAQLLLRELGMRRCGRMNDQAFGVRDIGQQGKQLQPVDKILRLLLSALDFKGKYGARALRKYAL